MRFFLFVLTIVSSTAALAGSPVSGTIARNGQSLFLISSDSCTRYELTTRNEAAMDSLLKLSDGDIITATGNKIPASCQINVETIDYVGLKRLLGVWYSKDAVVEIHNYNEMSFYPLVMTDIVNSITPTSVDYKYSLIPSEGKEWVVFLSDKKTTTFATLQFSKGPVIMKIYSESGDVTKTMILFRKGN
ncbi:MAG: hypothetical protein ACM3MG_04470 [Bacillota bacterium]